MHGRMNTKKYLLVLELVLMVAVRSFEFTFDTFIIDKLDLLQIITRKYT
jgi:hypothetical protein